MGKRIRCSKCQTRYLLRDDVIAERLRCKRCSAWIAVCDDVPLAEHRDPPMRTAKRCCPCCDNIELKVRELKNGLQIDVCPACKGHWLDSGELLQMTNETSIAREQLSLLSWQAAETTRLCPCCGTPMREGTLLNDDTKIDFCDDCGGLWFDAGELKESLQQISNQSVFESQRPVKSAKSVRRNSAAPVVSEWLIGRSKFVVRRERKKVLLTLPPRMGGLFSGKQIDLNSYAAIFTVYFVREDDFDYDGFVDWKSDVFTIQIMQYSWENTVRISKESEEALSGILKMLEEIAPHLEVLSGPPSLSWGDDQRPWWRQWTSG